ncbi:BRO family protein [Leptospira sp. 96542]|nr:BRO family protein [Leptospira sp. 96542]
MSTTLTSYDFAPGMALRVIEREGQPWFVAKDACGALGIVNMTQALEEINARDKSIHSIGLRGKAPWLVSESGLYAMIFKSRKPEAKDFQRWVTSVVLPAIRKDGAYVKGEEKVATGEMSEDELLAKAVIAAHAKVAGGFEREQPRP